MTLFFGQRYGNRPPGRRNQRCGAGRAFKYANPDDNTRTITFYPERYITRDHNGYVHTFNSLNDMRAHCATLIADGWRRC